MKLGHSGPSDVRDDDPFLHGTERFTSHDSDNRKAKPAAPDVFRPGPSMNTMQMSYPKWCAMLVPLVLRSRSPFSAFLSRSIQLLRGAALSPSSTPAFFPVPLFQREQFHGMPRGLSSAKRRRFHLHRAVHVVCMALNYWNAGGRWIPDDELRRKPNAEHVMLYQRIASIIKSDGLAESFPLSKSGRKHPELLARLAELSTLLTAHGGAHSSYEKGFAGCDVPKAETSFSEVVPFSDLNASRLQLYGSGHWDVSDWLEDSLVMAYREPRSLLAGLELGPRPSCRDSEEEVARLAHLWDQSGLLYLHADHRPLGSLVKIFNCYKNESIDRQIGDRRGQNSYECRLIGPSRDLPAGPDMMDLQVDVKTSKVVMIITDRRDYYHQIWTTDARSSTNAVGPAVHRYMLEDTSAFSAFLLREASKKRAKREQRGDDLHKFVLHPGEAEETEYLPADKLWVCFNSILQGDHAGVEIATSAHEAWLQSYGLLDDFSRLTASRCLRSSKLLQGLVIDDYFAASVEPRLSSPESSAAMGCYRASQRAYKSASLLGSPAKDVVGECEGKLVGAYINSSSRALDRKLCTVGAPPMKRVALSFITLVLCSLQYTTDVLHLCLLGGWVATLTFRRPLMSILNRSYHVVNQNDVDANHPKLVKLSRTVADELVVLAALMPLAISDLGAEYYSSIFATDASSFKGAICEAQVKPELCRALWRSCRSKGSYTRILSPAEQILRSNGMFDEEKLISPSPTGPDRPLAFEYDFIEIFSGASLVSAAISLKGVIVGPPLDIGISPEYDLSFAHVMRWLTYMLAAKRLKAFLVSPPCTTFSIMRRPRLRSKMMPFGFDVTDEKTHTGNVLGQRGAQMMRIAAVNDAAGIMETTYSSYLKHLPGWQAVKKLPVADEVRCDSCRFGSKHLKPFRFLDVNIGLENLNLRCICTELHVRVEGSYTKESATYVPKLVDALADSFFEAICRIRRLRSEELSLDIAGLENQLVNEASLSSKWKVHSSWNFKRQSHINILEEASLLRLANSLARVKRPLRVVALVDSFVVRGATSKGRSSSKALSTVLRRVGAVSVAAGLYFTLPFVPTRWNPADDPTRDAELRPPYPGLELDAWDEEDLYLLSELPKTKKWASLWVRFVLRMLGPQCLHFSDRSVFRQSALLHKCHSHRGSNPLGFDKTLGYPGEGPTINEPIFKFVTVIACLVCALSIFWFSTCPLPSASWILHWTLHWPLHLSTWIAAVGLGVLCSGVPASRWLWISFMLVGPMPGAHAMPMFPRTAGERSKAAQRMMRPPVPPGRPVLPITQQRRSRLLDEFVVWTGSEGIDILTMLENHHSCIDDLNIILEKYGRAMYHCGKSYGAYAETINAITSWKPALRRMLGGAWDFGYAWNRYEPGTHHSAMPGPVALAIIATSTVGLDPIRRDYSTDVVRSIETW